MASVSWVVVTVLAMNMMTNESGIIIETWIVTSVVVVATVAAIGSGMSAVVVTAKGIGTGVVSLVVTM